MGLFARWMELRESNSRKRRIKAALRGEQPPLPGSYAANPRTDVDAMKVADKTGVVRKKYMHKCACPKCAGGDRCPCGPNCPCQKYHEEQSPDYSIDRWIDMANDLGDDMSVMRKDADDQEKDLDREIDSKKKETEKKTKDAQEKEDADEKEEKELWKKVKKHLKSNKKEKDSSEESSDSSSHSAQSSSSTSSTRRSQD